MAGARAHYELRMPLYEIVHVPTLAVNEARALVKLGRLVAASELYIEASRIPRDKSWQSTARRRPSLGRCVHS